MIIIKFADFGEFLCGRDRGAIVYDTIVNSGAPYGESFDCGPIFCDFTGVKAMDHGFCDVVFGQWVMCWPGTIYLDRNMPDGLMPAFDTVAETRCIKFDFMDAEKAEEITP